MTKLLNLLLIGPLPPPIGGVRVSFQQLVNDLTACEQVQVRVLNLPHQRGHWLERGLWSLAFVGRLFWLIARADVVSLHATAQAALLCGPLVWLLCKALGKKSILRKFGGNFDQLYQQLPHPLQWLMRTTTLQMDLLLFQTKHLVGYFQGVTNQPVAWFSNSRPLATHAETPGVHWDQTQPVAAQGASKFVFLGQVKETKGIYVLMEACRQLQQQGRAVTVDVYGPLDSPGAPDDFKNTGLTYQGILAPQAVIPTLRNYDVLLLPTYHPGEGYPGVILESYAAGLPVIATQWNAIPEIVDHHSGILVPPKSSRALSRAMLQLIDHPQEVARLRQGASQKAYEFSSQVWAQKFIDLAQDLVQKTPPRLASGHTNRP